MIADVSTLIKEFSRSNQPILVVGEDERDFITEISKALKVSAESVYSFDPIDGVEALRIVINDLYSRPISSKLKLLEISSCDKMNVEQSNTLLKILEEPPEYLRILLRASNLSSVISTIRSRSKIFVFGSSDQIYDSETTFEDLLKLPFYKFCQDISKLEKNDFTTLLLKGIDERKKTLLNKEDFELVELMFSSLVKIKNTNVNFRLLAEEIYLNALLIKQ